MKTKKYFIFVLGLFFILGISACNVTLSEDITPPPGSEMEEPGFQVELIEGVFPLNDPNTESGKAIFLEKCAPCHGLTGLGDGPDSLKLTVPVAAIGLFDVAMLKTPQEWFSLITIGNLSSFMPPFSGSLDEQDRWDVMAYVYSLGIDEFFFADGKAVYDENCAGCHGVEGRGDGPDAEDAADFTDQEKMVSVSGVQIVQSVAPGMGPEWHTTEGLEMNDYFSVAAYVRTLSFDPLLENIANSPHDSITEEPASEDDEEPAIEDDNQEELVVDDLDVVGAVNTVTVSGKVNFGSIEVSPEEISVDLFGYNEFEHTISVSSELNDDGVFIFDNIEFSEGMVLIASVDYKGVNYSSNFVIYEPDTDEFEVLINIFDTTFDTSELYADRLHIFFLFDTPELVQVVQVWLISNPSDKTITSINNVEPVLLFDIPEGAQNLLFENDELGAGRFVATEEGFGDLQPIIPGQGVAQVVYAFELPYKNKLTLSQTLNIPANDLLLFIPSVDIELIADNLLSEGMEDINGMEFLTYSLNNDSENIEVSLKGRHPTSSTGFDLDANNQNLIIGVVAFVVVTVGVIIWLRNYSTNDDYDEDSIDSSAEILDEIVSLDEAYENGDIDEEKYQIKRDELKEKLRNAMEN